MRKYFIFSIIILPIFVGHITSTAVTVAFPAMVSHFDTSLVLAGWVLTVYILVTIGSIPLIAKLSDNVGRRSTFMLCAVLFTAGSFFCSIAPNIGWLIFFRAVQGIGGGGFVSAGTGIISDAFPETRQRLIGLMVAVGTFGGVAGPGIGGVMVEHLGWQSVFWLGVPFGIVAAFLTMRYIKADTKTTKRGGLDFLGVGMLLGFASTMVVSITLMDKAYHIPPIFIVLAILLSILLLATFVYRSKKCQDSVFSYEMLVSRPFLAANLFNIAYGACSESGILSLLPLYAISVYGMSTLESGLVTIPHSIGVVVISILASLYIMKWGYRRPIVVGTLVVAGGLALLGLEPGRTTMSGMSPMMLVTLFGLMAGLGAGLAGPAANNSSIDLLPDQAASITGLRQICRRIGQTIAVTLSTLVLESSSSIAWGFTLIFLGFAALVLVSIVAAFWMPANPVDGTKRPQSFPSPKVSSG